MNGRIWCNKKAFVLLCVTLFGFVMLLPMGSMGQDKAVDKSTGDPYTLSTCPVTGEKLGGMGESVIHNYKGREICFCCADCVKKFEQKPEEYLGKIDKEMIQAQLKFYPVETCIVTGEKLGGSMGEPINYIYHNRLIRFCCKGCIDEFNKEPAKFLAKLDKAVIDKQKKTYPLKTCVVTGEKLTDKSVDLVVANRLIRLCCADCKAKVAKNPVEYLSKLDKK